MNLPVCNKNSNAFTLVELLIVVSIIVIITGALVPSFTGYLKNQNILQAREQLKSDLRSVQNKALAGSLSDYNFGTVSNEIKIAYWGINFTAGSKTYSYFISAENTSCLPVHNLAQGTSTALPGGNDIVNKQSGCVFFSLASGSATATPSSLISNGLITLQVGDSSTTKTITINSEGLIRNAD